MRIHPPFLLLSLSLAIALPFLAAASSSSSASHSSDHLASANDLQLVNVANSGPEAAAAADFSSHAQRSRPPKRRHRSPSRSLVPSAAELGRGPVHPVASVASEPRSKSSKVAPVSITQALPKLTKRLDKRLDKKQTSKKTPKRTSKKTSKKTNNSTTRSIKRAASPSSTRASPRLSSKSSVHPLPPLPKNARLLLLPNPNSVWQAGTYQTVRWSKKYMAYLPADTTVDIILVNAKTNQKVVSLKRFVPFKAGAVQVLVPAKLSAIMNSGRATLFVLVLELYHGRSQRQITSTLSLDQYSQQQQQQRERRQPNTPNVKDSEKTERWSNMVRRSDINIAPTATSSSNGSRMVARDIDNAANRDSNPIQDSKVVNSRGNIIGGQHHGISEQVHGRLLARGTHRDLNNNDYYLGAVEERSLDFLPDEMRQEYPSTVQALDLEHTFGLHQKVYRLTPYTLEWRMPARVTELLEYTRHIQSLAGWSRNSGEGGDDAMLPGNRPLFPRNMYLAKILVELVQDQTQEPVLVLARDVPAETMFQYLSIRDRVPSAFYRLRVQMVVVEVRVEDTKAAMALELGGPPMSVRSGAGSKYKGRSTMEGWEFPNGGRVVDRYESVTRRFWVAVGAI